MPPEELPDIESQLDALLEEANLDEKAPSTRDPHLDAASPEAPQRAAQPPETAEPAEAAQAEQVEPESADAPHADQNTLTGEIDQMVAEGEAAAYEPGATDDRNDPEEQEFWKEIDARASASETPQSAPESEDAAAPPLMPVPDPAPPPKTAPTQRVDDAAEYAAAQQAQQEADTEPAASDAPDPDPTELEDDEILGEIQSLDEALDEMVDEELDAASKDFDEPDAADAEAAESRRPPEQKVPASSDPEASDFDPDDALDPAALDFDAPDAQLDFDDPEQGSAGAVGDELDADAAQQRAPRPATYDASDPTTYRPEPDDAEQDDQPADKPTLEHASARLILQTLFAPLLHLLAYLNRPIRDFTPQTRDVIGCAGIVTHMVSIGLIAYAYFGFTVTTLSVFAALATLSAALVYLLFLRRYRPHRQVSHE